MLPTHIKKATTTIEDDEDDAAGSSFELLYAVNGPANARKFHKKCDNAGATITIVETRNGMIFGG